MGGIMKTDFDCEMCKDTGSINNSIYLNCHYCNTAIEISDFEKWLAESQIKLRDYEAQDVFVHLRKFFRSKN